jgi:hypothetical protein
MPRMTEPSLWFTEKSERAKHSILSSKNGRQSKSGAWESPEVDPEGANTLYISNEYGLIGQRPPVGGPRFPARLAYTLSIRETANTAEGSAVWRGMMG